MWCSTSLMSREIFPCLQRVLAQGRDHRGHGNKLPFELANGVLLFCWSRRKQRNSPGALLCCAVCGTRFNKGLCGREHRRERERRQVGGAGSCTAPESIGVQHADSWGRQDSQATGLLSVLSCWQQNTELALRSPAWGQPGGKEGKAQPSLPQCVATTKPPPECRVLARCACGPPSCCQHHPRKILRMTSKRGQENGSLDKILHAFAYESWHNSNSQKPKLGPLHGLAAPFVPSVAAPCSQAHQCGLGHLGEVQDLVSCNKWAE